MRTDLFHFFSIPTTGAKVTDKNETEGVKDWLNSANRCCLPLSSHEPNHRAEFVRQTYGRLIERMFFLSSSFFWPEKATLWFVQAK
jgi:hypothetical protein